MHAASKSQHNVVVAAWIVSTFGQFDLREGRGVLDIAGGNGILSYELCVRYGVPSTLIEPRDDIALSSMLRRKMKRINKSRTSNEEVSNRAPLMNLLYCHSLNISDDKHILPLVIQSIQDGCSLPFHHVIRGFPLYLRDVLGDATLMGIIDHSSLVVGVHSDEVTEAIIEIAIYLRKPFVLVPCCLFSHLYPERKTLEGEEVRSYEEFIVYLKQKHVKIEQAELPFEGRNILLYCSDYT